MGDDEWMELLRSMLSDSVENKLQTTNRKLKRWLTEFGKVNGCLSDLRDLNSQKYYIGYVECELQVCGTYIGLNGNITYFSKRDVANKALNIYKPVLSKIVELEFIRLRLKDSEISLNELENIKTILDRM